MRVHFEGVVVVAVEIIVCTGVYCSVLEMKLHFSRWYVMVRINAM